MSTLQHLCWHSGSSVVMTNGLPSKPIPPSWPASRPFVLRGQPPAASLAQAAPSRAAPETSGACPPAGNARRGSQTNSHPTTAPHKPVHHGHRPTTSTQESITSPPAPRPTRPHRVTLLPTSTPGKKWGTVHGAPRGNPVGKALAKAALGTVPHFSRPRPMPQAPVARSPVLGSAAFLRTNPSTGVPWRPLR